MVDPAPTNPGDVVRKVASAAGVAGDNKVGVETIDGKIAPNQEAPRSDNPTPADAGTVASPETPVTAPDPVATGTEAKSKRTRPQWN